MDFKNLKGIWKLKKCCITCIEFIFKYFVLKFYFQFEVFLVLIFRCLILIQVVYTHTQFVPKPFFAGSAQSAVICDLQSEWKDLHI